MPVRIIYFDLDSMRPDHFGCYGYHRNTTPNMDRIAREGVRFTRAYCASSPCVPSRAGFISGRFGIHNGVVTHWGPGSHFRFPGEAGYRADMPLFTRYLRQHGYKTVSFSSFADRHLANWFYAGWSEMHTHTLKMGNEDADEVNAAVLPWIEAHGAEDDYFLHIQYWDPHRNYTMPPRWAELFEDEPPPGWPDQEAIDRHQANYGPFSASELFPWGDKSPVPTMPDRIATEADFHAFVNGYDGAIRYMDECIGRVFEALDRLGALDETAIIFSADHGEAMGEQGIYGDHVCAGEAVHGIPMIIRWPGITPADKAYDGLMYNIDLQPTVCELLGLPVPPGWDGKSVAAAVRGEAWDGRPYLVWDHGLYCAQRAVRTKDWLYTRTYHPGLFPWDDVILWDMQADPHQTVNVATSRGDVVAELDHQMMNWLHDQLGRHGNGVDPLQEVVRDGAWRYVNPRQWLERLEAKGRHDAVEDLLERLGTQRDLRTPLRQ